MRLPDRLSAIWHSPEQIARLEKLIMTTASDFVTRLNTVADELARELSDLQTQVAGSNQAWADALNGPISRLEAMGTSDVDPDPAGGDTGATGPTA